MGFLPHLKSEMQKWTEITDPHGAQELRPYSALCSEMIYFNIRLMTAFHWLDSPHILRTLEKLQGELGGTLEN